VVVLAQRVQGPMTNEAPTRPAFKAGIDVVPRVVKESDGGGVWGGEGKIGNG